MYFVNCKRIPQQERFLCSSFFLSFFDRSDKVLTCFKTCPFQDAHFMFRLSRPKIIMFRLSQPKFGLGRPCSTETNVLDHVRSKQDMFWQC